VEEQFVDKSRVSIRKISKKIAKKLIVENHYSHAWTACRYALGIFYETDNEHTFFDEKEEKLIGVLIYGCPIGRLAAQSISKELKQDEVLELTRLWIEDGYGKNVESHSISQSIKWLKENAKDIKVLMSYADPTVGHLGGIYQATNWIYQGDGMRLVDAYSLKLEEDSEWMHSRTVFGRWGSNNLEHLKRKIGHTFWIKEELRKHRYIYLLCSKKDKKKLLRTLKYKPLSYPKINDISKIETIKIEVESKFE